MNERIFREYDIRGIADRDFTDDAVALLSRATGTLLKRRGAKQITLGQDCRLSSPRIAQGMRQGLLGSGLDVVDIGLVPTPLLYFSVFHLDVGGGVMITGSHNPGDQNGLKIMSGKSTVFGEDIQEILAIAKREDFERGQGRLTEVDIKPAYLDAVQESVPGPLKVKAVIDCGNGTAGVVAGALLRRLGCEVTELFPEPDGRFPNHHPDPTMPENLEDLTKAVKQQGALLGIAFDGDSDRIGVVDRDGRPIFGDELLILYARDILRTHPGAKIISEVKASHRLFQDIAKHDGKGILWKTGHSLIKAKMKQEGALLAGEMSGHMFFNDRFYGFDDAIYAAARLLEIIAREKKSPGQLLSDLPKTVCTPELRVDCSDDIKFKVVERARERLMSMGHEVNGIDGARVEFGDAWGLVRASNTQPVLVFRFEASDDHRLKEIRTLIERIVQEEIKKIG